MRCVDKGIAPQIYAYYKQARNDLGDRIGWICSYCEMPVKNMIEVEHVHPIREGGDELEWDNFLLSCRYCNGVKNNRNANRAGYLWPDVDNSILAFEYSELHVIEPAGDLAPEITNMAQRTIDLMGLNRHPGLVNEPTDADSRWIHRIEAWGIIEESYSDWINNRSPAFARQIARTALGQGFYSFWIKKFCDERMVINEINHIFPNKYQPKFNADNELVLRPNGSF